VYRGKTINRGPGFDSVDIVIEPKYPAEKNKAGLMFFEMLMG
jgi:hypothetical protein